MIVIAPRLAEHPPRCCRFSSARTVSRSHTLPSASSFSRTTTFAGSSAPTGPRPTARRRTALLTGASSRCRLLLPAPPSADGRRPKRAGRLRGPLRGIQRRSGRRYGAVETHAIEERRRYSSASAPPEHRQGMRALPLLEIRLSSGSFPPDAVPLPLDGTSRGRRPRPRHSPGGATPLFAEVAAALAGTGTAIDPTSTGSEDASSIERTYTISSPAATRGTSGREERSCPAEDTVRSENGTPPLHGGHSLCQELRHSYCRPDRDRLDRDSGRGRQRDRLPRGRDDTSSRSSPGTVPWIHVAFENAAAVASGAEAAYGCSHAAGRCHRRVRPHSSSWPETAARTTFGLQALSGALERGHRLPLRLRRQRGLHEHGRPALRRHALWRNRTMRPAGTVELGKAQQRKDMTAIAVAQPRPIRRPGGGVALVRPEHEGRPRRRQRRPRVPQRPHRLSGRLGSRAATRSTSSQRSRQELLLAAVRGCRRRLPFDVPTAAAHPRRGVAPSPDALPAPLPARERGHADRSSAARRRRVGRASRAVRHARPAALVGFQSVRVAAIAYDHAETRRGGPGRRGRRRRRSWPVHPWKARRTSPRTRRRALELGAIGHTFSAALDDDRIRAVAVEQDDLRLVSEVAGLVRDGSAREVRGFTVPPEPDRGRVRPSLRGRGHDPDLAQAGQAAVDVVPGDVPARRLRQRTACSLSASKR